MPITSIYSVLHWLLLFLLRLHSTNLRRRLVRPQLSPPDACLKNNYSYTILVVIGLAVKESNYKQALLSCLRGVWLPFTKTISLIVFDLYCHQSIRMNGPDSLLIFPSNTEKTLLPKLFVKSLFIFHNVVKLCSLRYFYLRKCVCPLLKQL